ncbi:type II secretory pathway, ATPase PulE/Tfp pilus assembly pathway, ATPase PilB [Desulfosporosinus orientis DSM 765]|uniref:Type II secretory pathway, ATPase PulE/Tfp pilus assembly pathway, ATPase PilB n=1 Tax=Desulfosporosinus orientis (strain ATCC 19365 / DSM 765 / NCIMB 8382 / VKM B-1628 / Singapore I) TaxID=768706 RepID=G7W5L7_DESOD|nr:type II/IV secretion system protein [Desulfosporosinus orientis]AET66664.1 type II secretory pathway, ATPase PulE/Tfp pilus assembly pathway, ATPase PilB [Desulfosporosinus orientis DSM 765]
MVPRQDRKRLGEILIAGGVISPTQLDEALKTQKVLGLRLGEVLIHHGLVTEDDILRTMQSQLGLPLIDLNQIVVAEQILQKLPEKVARKYSVLPVEISDGQLMVAMSDPTDYFAIEDLRIAVGMPIVPCLAQKDQILNAIDRYYSHQDAEKAAREYAKHLMAKGLVSEEQILRTMQSQLGLPLIDLNKVIIPDETVGLIPESLARKYTIIPVEVNNGQLMVAMNDPTDYSIINELRQVNGMLVKPCLAKKKDILKAIDRYYAHSEAEKMARDYLRQSGSAVAATTQTAKVSLAGVEIDDETSTPIIKFLNTLIENAINNKASDIHIEPMEEELRIRFRIDGVLHESMRTPRGMIGPVVSRVKIMSDLNISERRLPQDGRISYQLGEKTIDLRVSTAPTMFGEKVVLRVLDKTNVTVDKESLGLEGIDQDRFNEFITRPYGIVLVTGPTGSGKSTTLYTMLNQLNTPEKNIITLEDPVEFNFSGINQIQINPKAGLTFATGLRSILRQDPDVIMVGEMRDKETAEIAVRAALTGHLVLSTIHTNDAASAINRLVDMQIEPYLLSASLLGVISQRLIRKTCPKCAAEYEASPLDHMFLERDLDVPLELKKGKGCSFCYNSGYKGRRAIFEIMPITSEHRVLINRRASVDEIRKLSIKHGMKTLKKAAAKLVLQGITTMDELLRVTFVNE